MDRIIANTYEIIKLIGAGGGGVVYLANHQRLGKKIVLKADKRKITTNEESLRREVDVLKNLHHQYIPQVYDYFREGDSVYTAMEYIDGESLDKPLARQETFSQADVVKWGAQLLQALAYLHSPIHGDPPRGYIHSDIKPANLMRMPDGNIVLIDFNIAVALGEEQRHGSVGYASPEHFGLDFSTDGSSAIEDSNRGTNRLINSNTITDDFYHGASKSTTNRHILPDARSDIYSAGATLYHLLSGTKPPKSAFDVTPLSKKDFSPQIVDIIAKSMNPNPDLRFQTAESMLDALRNLRRNDSRTVQYRKYVKTAAAACAILLAIGGGMTFTGQYGITKQARIAEEYEKLQKQTLADVTASEDAYRQGDAPKAVSLAKEALSRDTIYNARAENALSTALGVYDLSDSYRPYLLINLPAEPVKAGLSPNGKWACAIAGEKLNIFDVETGAEKVSLPVGSSALTDFVFRDENTVIYAGDGALKAYDLSQNKELWSGQNACKVVVSGDGSTVAAAESGGSEAVIYDAQTGAIRRTISFDGNHLRAIFNDTFADPQTDLFTLNENGTMLAVGFSEGGATLIYDTSNSNNDIEIFAQSEFSSFSGGFYDKYFAFSGFDGTNSSFMAVDTLELVATAAFDGDIKFHTSADKTGIYISAGHLLAQLDPISLEETEIAYSDDYITKFTINGQKTLIQAESGKTAFYNAPVYINNGPVMEQTAFLDLAGDYALMTAPSAQTLTLYRFAAHDTLLSYDPAYEHIEARISGDGQTVMLFIYNQFRILSMDGTVIADVAIPIPEGDQVYDQQFRRDENGSRLEVTYYSGLVRNYSAADGSVLSEERVEPRSEDLTEEFLTDEWHVICPYHGTPQVYDRETNELLGELQSEDSIMYVTQVGDYVMTQYLSQQGERYGALLNKNLEEIAKLPNLCDFLPDGSLLFDDTRGNIRQTHILSVEELLALAEQY